MKCSKFVKKIKKMYSSVKLGERISNPKGTEDGLR